MKVFINAPYDSHVNANTRFWSASGIDVKLDASGIQVETQSIVSILIGGVAFETPEGSAALPAAAAKTEFILFPNHTAALKNPETESLKLLFVFNESARGLAVGAPVDFRGVVVGEVSSVRLDIDRKTGQINNAVTVDVYPARMRAQSRQQVVYEGPAKQRELVEAMVKRGLRAQLRSGSLLTGQLYVALDFFPKAPAAKIDWTSAPPQVPTTQGSLVELQQALGSIAAKIEKLPLEQIAGDTRQALQSATGLIKRVDADVAPDLRLTLQSATRLLNQLDADTVPEVRNALAEIRKTLASADRLMSSDAPLQTDTRDAMRELSRTAQSFRLLADYLEQHPQAVLMGRKEAGQ
jgi:paraquat-inducible protein B